MCLNTINYTVSEPEPFASAIKSAAPDIARFTVDVAIDDEQWQRYSKE